MEELVYMISRSAPSAFIGMVVAIAVAYLWTKVKIVESQRVREMEERQINELLQEIDRLRAELKDKDSKIEILHQQIIDIATAQNRKGDIS